MPSGCMWKTNWEGGSEFCGDDNPVRGRRFQYLRRRVHAAGGRAMTDAEILIEHAIEYVRETREPIPLTMVFALIHHGIDPEWVENLAEEEL